jgi:small-conductance mechanosensitive channel
MEEDSTAQSNLTERRIGQYTLVLGGAASVIASYYFSLRVGAGLLIGALIAWANFRWLERTMDAVTRASTAQASSPEARIPIIGYFGLFARYALIAVVVYATFSVFRIPVLSMVVGLCTLGAAAMLATLLEVLNSSSKSH